MMTRQAFGSARSAALLKIAMSSLAFISVFLQSQICWGVTVRCIFGPPCVVFNPATGENEPSFEDTLTADLGQPVPNEPTKYFFVSEAPFLPEETFPISGTIPFIEADGTASVLSHSGDSRARQYMRY